MILPNILYENNFISKKNLIINFWLFLNRIIYTNAEKLSC